MNFAVDQINENIVILENTQTGEKKEIEKNILPENIKEGSILTLEGNNYVLNTSEEEQRRERIREKLERLKRLKNKE